MHGHKDVACQQGDTMEGEVQRGLTLPELLATLTVSAILAGYAVPSGVELLAQARLATQVNSFLNSYHLARAEAIRHGRPIHLCSRERNQCSNTAQWDKGWLVFEDRNHNSTADADEILEAQEAIPPGYRLTPNINAGHLVFQGNGYVRKLNGSLPLMTLRLCSPQASSDNVEQESRELVINGSGRVRLQRGRAGITDCSNT